MLDFRKYRNFSRFLFKINMVLGFVFLISQIYAYVLLYRPAQANYYIQTNNGFVFRLSPVDPSSPNKSVIEPYFQ